MNAHSSGESLPTSTTTRPSGSSGAASAGRAKHLPSVVHHDHGIAIDAHRWLTGISMVYLD
jgi:hypothetical protein